MVETAPRKQKEYLQTGARVITTVYHVTKLSECSRRYGSVSKTKLVMRIVFKISGDKLPSDHLRMNVRARFDIGGGVLKLFKVNLRSCSLAPGPILSPSFIHPPVMSPNLDVVPNSSRIEVYDNFTLTTRNDKNLMEVDSEEVGTIFDSPRNISRNPNSRNDVDGHGVRWMENNSDAKRGQNDPILTRRWGIWTITGEVLTKEYDSGKRMLRLEFFLLMFPPSQLTQCTLLTNIALRRQQRGKS